MKWSNALVTLKNLCKIDVYYNGIIVEILFPVSELTQLKIIGAPGPANEEH